jgi:hypothetical protein
MRVFLIVSFLCLILASVVSGIVSFKEKEWETLTASFSLLIAIISAWVAYEGLHKQFLLNKPQIVLMVDFKSRVELIQLVAKNLGQRPAFNIKIHWDQPLLNLEGDPISFNKFSSDTDIPVLNPSETASVLIDSTTGFFQKNRDKNLDFSGEIIFQEALNTKKKVSQPFQFSFKHYGASLIYDEEGPKTMAELQKIPKALKEIHSELALIRKTITNSSKDDDTPTGS